MAISAETLMFCVRHILSSLCTGVPARSKTPRELVHSLVGLKILERLGSAQSLDPLSLG